MTTYKKKSENHSSSNHVVDHKILLLFQTTLSVPSKHIRSLISTYEVFILEFFISFFKDTIKSFLKIYGSLRYNF